MRQLLFVSQDVRVDEALSGQSDEILQSVEQGTGDLQREQKTAHFLLLMGESGIGKTRLAEELSQEADVQGWSVAWTHAYEQESTIPYRPWTEVLRILLQDAPPDSLISNACPQLATPLSDTSFKTLPPPTLH